MMEREREIEELVSTAAEHYEAVDANNSEAFRREVVKLIERLNVKGLNELADILSKENA